MSVTSLRRVQKFKLYFATNLKKLSKHTKKSQKTNETQLIYTKNCL